MKIGARGPAPLDPATRSRVGSAVDGGCEREDLMRARDALELDDAWLAELELPVGARRSCTSEDTTTSPPVA
jgi:hypothetical protein